MSACSKGKHFTDWITTLLLVLIFDDIKINTPIQHLYSLSNYFSLPFPFVHKPQVPTLAFGFHGSWLSLLLSYPSLISVSISFEMNSHQKILPLVQSKGLLFAQGVFKSIFLPILVPRGVEEWKFCRDWISLMGKPRTCSHRRSYRKSQVLLKSQKGLATSPLGTKSEACLGLLKAKGPGKTLQ